MILKRDMKKYLISDCSNYYVCNQLKAKPSHKGLSDFIHNSSPEEKKQVFMEAAKQANEEQRKMMESVKHISQLLECTICEAKKYFNCPNNLEGIIQDKDFIADCNCICHTKPVESWEDCRVCDKRFVKYRPQNIYCSYKCCDKARYYRSREKRLAKDKEYYQQHPDKWNEKARKSRARYPEKWAARQKVHMAVFYGRLKKKPCELCGAKNVQGHHTDYSKPLEVKWLCATHHGEQHR